MSIQKIHYMFLVNKNLKGKGEQTRFIVTSPNIRKSH